MNSTAAAAPASDADETSIEVLVAAAQDGDDRAFDEIMRRYAPRVARLVARFVRSATDLDEVAQDVFVKAHRNLRGYRGQGPFEHWLLRIATRRCHDYLRAAYRKRLFLSFDHLQESGFEAAAVAVADEDPRLPALRAALGRLRPDDRLVVTLLNLENHPVAEVAELTGWSESKVKVRAHRARLKLRLALERTSPEPS